MNREYKLFVLSFINYWRMILMADFKNKQIEEKASEILKSLSLENKIGQLVQYGKLKEREMMLVKKGNIGSFLNVYGAEKINKLQKTIMESECRIPLLFGDDVIHGYRTIFPIPLAESCSWNLGLMEETSAISAKEASTEGINVIFAPMVDIARDPRWGRVAEGAGEDTYLGSQIAKARVRGIQRNNWHHRAYITACPKHFLGYAAAEGGRDYNSVDISERTIRETYLPPFKEALQEGVGTIMCSFNDLNGIPSTGNKFLLKNILRKELGFQGIVISDWESVEELIYHGIAEDKKEASVKAAEATVDIDMNSGSYEENLMELVKEGIIKEDLIDDAVKRIIKLKLSLKLFDKSYIDTSLSKKIIRCKEHIEKSRQAARESIVLLKNENKLLPLNKNIKSIALIGPLADDKLNPLGCWALKGNPENVVSVMEGLKNKIGDEVTLNYVKGSEILSSITGGEEAAVEAAEKSEAVIMVLGESADMSGENHNRAHIGIPDAQRQLLKEVLKVNKNIVLVLMNGRPLTLEWENHNVPAILEAWHLGDESGNAISDVIFGDYNPSGRLTITFPRCEGQIPMYYNHKSTGRPGFKKYLDVDETPLYPFGYGLGYAKFQYRNIRLSSNKIKADETLQVEAEIANTGDVSGEEIVQLYIRDITASITRPVKELKGFKKIYLGPGQSKKITFNIGEEQLKFLDENYNYKVEAGKFNLWIAPNSSEGTKIEFEVTD